MSPFQESFFVVAFSGENPASRLVHTWDAVLSYLDYELGLCRESSVKNPECDLHDADNWSLVDYSEDGDRRHVYHAVEFAYNVGLTITRITDAPTSVTKEIVESPESEADGSGENRDDVGLMTVTCPACESQVKVPSVRAFEQQQLIYLQCPDCGHGLTKDEITAAYREYFDG